MEKPKPPGNPENDLFGEVRSKKLEKDDLFGEVVSHPQKAPPKAVSPGEQPRAEAMRPVQRAVHMQDDEADLFGDIASMETEKLRPDFSNIDRVDLKNLREGYARNPRAMRERLGEAMLRQTRTGNGIDIQIPFQHYLQQLDTCQTTSILNGLRAMLGEQVFNQEILHGRDPYALIHLLKASTERAGLNGYMALDIAETMKRAGYPIEATPLNGQPVEMVRDLWTRPKQFLACSRGSVHGMGHVVCMLPVMHPTADRFIAEADSLQAQKTLHTTDSFSHLALTPGVDFTLIKFQKR